MLGRQQLRMEMKAVSMKAEYCVARAVADAVGRLVACLCNVRVLSSVAVFRGAEVIIKGLWRQDKVGPMRYVCFR